MYDQVGYDGISANQFILTEPISETFDDIFSTIPFKVDRPTVVMAVQKVTNSTNKSALGWIGICKLLIPQ